MIHGAYTKIVNAGIVGYRRIAIGEIANDLVQVLHGGLGGILANGVDRVQANVGGIAREVGGSLDNTFEASLSDTSRVRRRFVAPVAREHLAYLPAGDRPSPCPGHCSGGA